MNGEVVLHVSWVRCEYILAGGLGMVSLLVGR